MFQLFILTLSILVYLTLRAAHLGWDGISHGHLGHVIRDQLKRGKLRHCTFLQTVVVLVIVDHVSNLIGGRLERGRVIRPLGKVAGIKHHGTLRHLGNGDLGYDLPGMALPVFKGDSVPIVRLHNRGQLPPNQRLPLTLNLTLNLLRPLVRTLTFPHYSGVIIDPVCENDLLLMLHTPRRGRYDLCMVLELSL